MPPAAVKTIKDLIFYQYSKLIASSANINTPAFRMKIMAELKLGKKKISGLAREGKMQMSGLVQCEYCQATENLSWDHIIPKVKGGLDSADNGAWACRPCNSSKGSKGIYEWYGLENKDKVPRIVVGKYLKLLYEIHEAKGTLNATDLNGDGKLNVLDLEFI